MNPTIYRITVLAAVVCFAVYPAQVGAQTADLQTSPQMREKEQQINAMINTPFDFYGKVVDANGAPVSGATAK